MSRLRNNDYLAFVSASGFVCTKLTPKEATDGSCLNSVTSLENCLHLLERQKSQQSRLSNSNSKAVRTAPAASQKFFFDRDPGQKIINFFGFSVLNNMVLTKNGLTKFTS